VPRVLSIETPTHGRVVIDAAADSAVHGLIVAFHGYGQRAEDILDEVRRVPDISGWHVAAVQALHRFYDRSNQKIIASWMTREDRDAAIADNVTYVNRAVDETLSSLITARGAPPSRARPAALADSLSSGGSSLNALCFLGFSQGVAMAFRAALLGSHRATGVIALGGDIPPELKSYEAARWPPVLIGGGVHDSWYSPEKLEQDVSFLENRQIPHRVIRFDGGHQWTDEFRAAVGAWLSSGL
jgi:predicted esterase